MRAGSPTSRRGGLLTFAVAGALTLGGLTACGDDESAEDEYCAAGEDFRASLDALLDIDISGGVPAVSEALDTVRAELTDLQAAAGDAVAEEIDAFEQAVNEIGDSLSGLGDDLSAANVQAVGTALSAAATAAQDIYATLTDC